MFKMCDIVIEEPRLDVIIRHKQITLHQVKDMHNL